MDTHTSHPNHTCAQSLLPAAALLSKQLGNRGLERIRAEALGSGNSNCAAGNSACLPARPRPCPAAGVFSVLAVILGQLPGDWGFFGAYLTGGVVLAVLAVGSTAPGLLQGIIDKFSQLWPDYKERVVAHEAAHLLIGECLWLRIVVGPPAGAGLGQEEGRVRSKAAKTEAFGAQADCAVRWWCLGSVGA